MHASKTMGKSMRDAQKNIAIDPANLETSRQHNYLSFSKLLGRGIPKAMGAELFDYAWDGMVNEGRLDLAGDLLDLVNQDYDEIAKPLNASDWQFMADCVPEYDQELDIELLQYLMIQIVENGALKE